MPSLLSTLALGSLARDALRVVVGLALAVGVALAFAVASVAALLAPPVPPPLAAPSASGPAPTFPLEGPGAGVPSADLGALPALNQYEARHYASQASWLRWRDASCSAASLAWLLRAYGVPIRTIDEAIALIGEGTGISTQLGLLDASGRPLARAVNRVGLVPRNTNIGRSPETLKAWLDAGPLALDGHAWFGYGHWFIAYGYDAGGVFTRDSSGHDVRYLTWARLYGAPVGFSGNVVGIAGGPPRG